MCAPIPGSTVRAACVGLLLVLACGTPGRAGEGQPSEARPRFVNAQVDARSAATGLIQTFHAIVAAQQAPAWLGYAVAAVPGEREWCDNCGPDRCGTSYLEGWRHDSPAAERDRQAALDAPRSLAVLVRVEHAGVQKLRLFSPTCELDAGGLPVHWLTEVTGAQSVVLLSSYVKPQGEAQGTPGPSTGSVVAAVAQHADPSALHALEGWVAPGQPDSARRSAAFWLGSAWGREGFDTLRRLLSVEADAAFRPHLVFPIAVSRVEEAVDSLIALARQDPSAAVRKQAVFWLGQKAGSKVAATISDAVANDPETAVKERAVFALSRLPNGEGVPLLIEVAKTNTNLVVRKRAMFWLGQSNDPRALEYLVQVLR